MARDATFLIDDADRRAHHVCMTLGEWLSLTGTRPAALARTLDVERSTVHRWLTENMPPSMEMMRRIAEATDGAVMPNDFMGMAKNAP